MTSFRIFLAPLAYLLIGAIGTAKSEGSVASNSGLSSRSVRSNSLAGPSSYGSWRAPPLQQVRIEQHLTIRINPGTASMPPWVMEELEDEQREYRMSERKIGKCLIINSIAAVHPGDRNELLLFLRDQRIVSAMLDKHCSARDFYSGFYLTHNLDGAICAGRDILQSRSGANCTVKRLKELVPSKFRRFP